MIDILSDEYRIRPNFEKTRELFYESLFQMAEENIRPMPGALELIERVRSHLPLAVASTSRHDFIDLVLTSLHIKGGFDIIVSGQDVTKSKPEPDIFLLAAKKFRKDPTQCVVIEDSVAGATAAERAGMRCIVFAPRLIWDEYPMSAIKMDRLDSITVEYIKNL